MKNSSLAIRICAAIAFTVVLVSISQAQNREKFVISARAGGVNSVTGRVLIKQTGQSERLLTDRDNLTSGDVVRTSMGGRVEVLLNPGSYLRVGEGSEFELADNSLANLEVKLTKGSAVVEATGFDSLELRISVVNDQARFMIVRRGVYRINAQPGSTELLVRKGRVVTADGFGQVVKGGNKLLFSKGGVLTAKLDKKDQDDFDIWSKQRAETLARANEKLASRAFNTYLSSFNNSWQWSFGGFPGRSGFWAYSPFSSCYTFVPFYYGWPSPYGHYYGSYFGGYDYFSGGCCGGGGRIVRDPVIVSSPPSSSGSFGNSSSGSSSGYGGFSGGPRNSTPVGVGSSPSSPPAQTPPRDPDAGGRLIRKLDP